MSVQRGQIDAQVYPVTVTGVLPPYAPIKNFVDAPATNPFKELVRKIAADLTGFSSFDGVMAYLGLHPYPKVDAMGVYQVSHPAGLPEGARLGFGLMERGGAQGFTFSCAACHSANLFGKTILGMTNRFPRANDFFVKVKNVSPYVDPWFFQYWTGATDAETKLMVEMMTHLDRVAVREPLVLGLDTSLAQVGLSLNRRSADAYASPSLWYQNFPRRDVYLDYHPADSKPAVWWNVKYKNRWLSDGSVISGNPIFTNFIWNEIGRGADIHELENWLAQNQQVVDDMTAVVFASEAPKFTDFFPAEKIELNLAKRGEAVFNQNCARCHGTYDKAWNLPNADQLSAKDRLATVAVHPRRFTPVEDVGTDPNRRLGMKSLERLNNLEISKKNGIVIQPQAGYVPPPLVGIWARWPYFHNNSVPSLCAVLTAGVLRPVTYYAGEAQDTEKDFDADCNGYPLGDKTPAAWKRNPYFYDTRRVGMSNRGHDEGIFLENGKEILTAEDKKALIRFLQTL